MTIITGITPENAWKTIDKVNICILQGYYGLNCFFQMSKSGAMRLPPNLVVHVEGNLPPIARY
jgi:hypothetical protein